MITATVLASDRVIKRCCRCTLDLPVANFGKNAARYDGYDTMCKPCKKEYYGGERLARKMVARRMRHQAIIDEARAVGCFTCGELDPTVLEFHHIEPRLGGVTVSELVLLSANRIRAEIAKCHVLCANCHQRVGAGTLWILEVKNVDQ